MTSMSPAAAHQHHPSANTTNSSFRSCCRCLFLLLVLLLILLIVAIILIIVLAVKPRKPQLDLQQVGFQYTGISPVTTQYAASVSLIIHILFAATNDNKVGIKYDESMFTVMYHGIPLGRGAVPGFYQPAHTVRRVETTIVVDRVSLIQANAADMASEASLNDRVALRVVGDVGARIRILGLNSPRVQVSVDCSVAISPRRQTLMSKQCGFDGLSV